ncbi:MULTISPECIES: universal stress protein [unclassified Streptomyces]|uniref:universal stress protein n=1 Tax=unclassified Streptomyces TaxID=2593676 RepID=UPI00131AC9FF|nr:MULTISPECIES: universal stress protein [unclassified Streptomyces]
MRTTTTGHAAHAVRGSATEPSPKASAVLSERREPTTTSASSRGSRSCSRAPRPHCASAGPVGRSPPGCSRRIPSRAWWPPPGRPACWSWARALGGVGGYLVGSVGMTVAGRVEVPVVLVRARGAGVPDGPVVAGLDLRRPCDEVPSFAFGEAARRRTSVHALYVQRLPVHALPGPPVGPDVRPAVAPEVAASLDEALEPWRAAYPEVAAEGRVVIGSAGQEVVRAAADASLVVVGRRARRSAPGAHIGGVAYAVLHHGRAPVALVPHG